MSHPSGKPRRSRSHLLLAWLVMATMFAIPAVITTTSAPVSAGQGARNILPALEENAYRDPDFPDSEGELKMPSSCGSKNINGGFTGANWYVRSSIGPGSTVWVGDEWTVEFVIAQEYTHSPYGNNGPDPLNLELKPTGPVEPAKAPEGDDGGDINIHSYDGSGSTGPKNAIGAWGYSFDSNSSPGIARFSDGADVRVIERIEDKKAVEI